MPLFSQSSEHVDSEPSVTRWSFQDFEHAYEMKFASKWIKGSSHTENQPMTNGNGQHQQSDGVQASQSPSSTPENGVVSRNKIPPSTAVYEQYLNKKTGDTQASNGSSTEKQDETWPPKALPDFGSPEMNELAQSITRDIVRDTSDVRWDSIKGLENAKRLMKEAVVMPIKYPQYFKGLLSPWKGILLFGPPGTGKTMLAKAVASECNTTFFNISASSIVSKWRGDSEKLVKVLFELARHFAPSTIFLDEIDAIISQRGDGRSEHEASRRLKTELLVQMDGLMKSNDLVFLLAATNLPWELDAAMLRRLEKRILVPLPEPEARRAMCESLLPKTVNADLPYDAMVELTEGYSGSDIRIVCKEAAMRPLRRLMTELERLEKEAHTEEDLPQIGPITEEDVRIALETTRPSAHLLADRYEQFDADFGSRAV
ncbi:katanin p60 ATPase-containing subunit A1 [Marchantia polymorpha subsp. ruderalis]|uniref:AAA+ ATPase domain-containing protein n=3 Tax=Marchantia polymorpha TaxID=3197 RepID=A0AAF6AXX9_MARPO|nr:hypothetical protein MARPO_0006s0087 [Marchantia polymorpha]BBN04613.1 hypothetical protein Mp_3g06170 [Marchantia polymorpha subsp. ruderalis]|eukprot:PTQ48049.1 hypothetical protein MARPO_0006s0087 [Marchantia polymorpha]